jgi:hypothetical protein
MKISEDLKDIGVNLSHTSVKKIVLRAGKPGREHEDLSRSARRRPVAEQGAH